MAAVAHLTLDRLRAAARAVAEAHGLDLVVLFGSAAREGFARARDVDVAVTGGAESENGWGYGLEAELASAFTRQLGTARVDVVRADRASEIFQAHAARDGVPLFERSAGAFAAFCREAARRFEAARPEHDKEWEETKRLIRRLTPPEPDYRPWGTRP